MIPNIDSQYIVFIFVFTFTFLVDKTINTIGMKNLDYYNLKKTIASHILELRFLVENDSLTKKLVPVAVILDDIFFEKILEQNYQIKEKKKKKLIEWAHKEERIMWKDLHRGQNNIHRITLRIKMIFWVTQLFKIILWMLSIIFIKFYLEPTTELLLLKVF